MASQYQIVRENENKEIEVLESSTRKRDIETAFNRWVRILNKNVSDFTRFIERRNQGYIIVTTFATFSTWVDEYYIRKVSI